MNNIFLLIEPVSIQFSCVSLCVKKGDPTGFHGDNVCYFLKI